MLSRVIYYDDSVLSSIHAALRKWHNWSFHGCSTAGATVLCVLPSRTVQKFWVQVQQFKRWPFYPSSSVGVAVTRRTMANYCCPFFFSFINHCIANTTISSFIMFCFLYYTHFIIIMMREGPNVFAQRALRCGGGSVTIINTSSCLEKSCTAISWNISR